MTRPRPKRERTLAGLLGDGAADLTQAAKTESQLPVTALRSGATQPRRTFGEVSLAQLAESIRTEGVLQPLLVRPVEGGYEIVAGERRWRAAQLAGLTEVPVLIRALSDAQARVAALIENLQREGLDQIDEVDGKLDLVAATLGLEREAARSRLIAMTKQKPSEESAALDAVFAPLGETWASFTKNKLRILAWPPIIVEALRAGLPRTLGAVVNGAPAEHHAALLDLARQGASRTQLMAEVARLAPRLDTPVVLTAGGVAKQLGSRRFMAGLSGDERTELDKWLARMPEALKRKVKG